MKFMLNLTTDNAAFHGEGCPDEEHECTGQALQVAQILRELANRIEGEEFGPSRYDGSYFQNVRDSYGNVCGTYAHKNDSYKP